MADQAVILAGGKGTRLGYPKAKALFGSQTLVERAVDLVVDAGLEAVVVAKSQTLPPLPRELSARVLIEPDEPVHPLLGLGTAAENLDGPFVVLPVDLPLLTVELLAALARRQEPLLHLQAGGRTHPLLGRVDPTQLPGFNAACSQAADTGDSVQKTLAAFEPVSLDESWIAPFGDPATLLLNVNDQDSLDRAVKRTLRSDP